ncbi:MAG TPA: serine hydrolase domain-containing protein [Acidobacteriaceae bacterium]
MEFQPNIAAARRTLDSAIKERIFPGAAFGIYIAGPEAERRFFGSGGHFTYASASPEVVPGTIYDLASVSKVVATTAMAMVLYDRGQFALDMPLEAILPAFNPTLYVERTRVTMRTLLTHSSGLPAHEYLYRRCRNRAQALAACLTMPLDTEPGTAYAYSDIGYILLGLALETIAGEALSTFCAREIFVPLGMSSTFFSPGASLRPLIPPTEHDTTFRHRLIQGEVHDENASLLGGSPGHAGLFSNAPDLLRFARCLLQGGPPLFAPGTVELFTTRAHLPEGSSRALGWDTPSAPSSSGHHFNPNSAGHLGFTGTSLWLDFERGLAVALLTNRTWQEPEAAFSCMASQDAIRCLRPRFHDALFEQLNGPVTTRKIPLAISEKQG